MATLAEVGLQTLVRTNLVKRSTVDLRSASFTGSEAGKLFCGGRGEEEVMRRNDG